MRSNATTCLCCGQARAFRFPTPAEDAEGSGGTITLRNSGTPIAGLLRNATWFGGGVELRFDDRAALKAALALAPHPLP